MSSVMPGCDQCIGIDTRMRRRGRVNDQRLGVANIGKMRCKFGVLDKCLAGITATLDAKTDDRAGAFGQIFLRQLMAGMRWQDG